jgi:hypothetical protein
VGKAFSCSNSLFSTASLKIVCLVHSTKCQQSLGLLSIIKAEELYQVERMQFGWISNWNHVSSHVSCTFSFFLAIVYNNCSISLTIYQETAPLHFTPGSIETTLVRNLAAAPSMNASWLAPSLWNRTLMQYPQPKQLAYKGEQSFGSVNWFTCWL